ncbi:hypothetical protein M3Y99_01040100 [Aphelenchoides fujianensis]|nr:hypothetical protein M3Y99_01040100 [Aphelenchoides fujianensis]
MLNWCLASVLLIAAAVASAAPRENVAYHVVQPLGNSSVAKVFEVPARCRLPLAVGSGETAETRFHFDEFHQCEPFTYAGAGGNANHFATRAECLAACTEDPCAAGALLAEDGARVECTVGAADRIDSCPLNAFCSHPHGVCCRMPSNDTDFCTLPKDEGREDALNVHLSAQRFAYNPKTNDCDKFEYKGIGGNKNRFESKGIQSIGRPL